MTLKLELNVNLQDQFSKISLTNHSRENINFHPVHMLVAAESHIQSAIPTDSKGRDLLISNTQQTCLNVDQTSMIQLIHIKSDLIIHSNRKTHTLLPHITCNSASSSQCLISVHQRTCLKTYQSSTANLTFSPPPSEASTNQMAWKIKCELNKTHPFQLSAVVLFSKISSQDAPNISAALITVKIANIFLIPSFQITFLPILFSDLKLDNKTEYKITKQCKNLVFDDANDQIFPLRQFSFKLLEKTTSVYVHRYNPQCLWIEEKCSGQYLRRSSINVKIGPNGEKLMKTDYINLT